jgi:MFS family permease
MLLAKKIRLFSVFNFFQSFNFYIPIKIIYFSHLTNDYALATSIISVVFISSALFEIPTGLFSDLIGRRKTIIAGLLFTIAAYVLYALGFNYWILIIGALLEGAARSFFSGNNDAYLHNLLSEEGIEGQYHDYYGKVNAYLSFASSTAALLSGFIANWSFTYFMWLNIIPQVISLYICWLMPETRFIKNETTNIYAHLKEAILEFKNNINLRLLSLSSILGSGPGLSAAEFHAAVIGSVWPLWAIGIAKAIQEWLVIPGFYFSGWVNKRFGAMNIVLFGSIQSWLGNIIAAVYPSVLSPLFIAQGTILYGPSTTAEQSLLQKEFTDKQRATMASLNSLATSIYFGIVAFGVGLFANKYGPFNALLLTQIIYIPSLFITWMLFKRIKADLKNNSAV